MVTIDSAAGRAVERVLELVELRYGPGAVLPDALTGHLLLAVLAEQGGTLADLQALIDARVLDPWYADLWNVWLTGSAASILEPPHDAEPAEPEPPVGPLLAAPVDAAAVPTGTVSIPIPLKETA